MKKIYAALFTLLFCFLSPVPSIQAQEAELILKMTRDWGYGGLNGDIQGLFSMRVTGPDALVNVEFFIDDVLIGTDEDAPFAIQFTTEDYPLGVHMLYAIGHLIDGQKLVSNSLGANFVPEQAVGQFLLPIFGILILAILGSTVIPFLATRNKKPIALALGEERHYGIGGGGICPNCKRPYALPVLSLNLGLSKYSRCPYCCKWRPIKVLPLASLREAEKSELSWASSVTSPISEEEKLRKELENTKYQQN